MSDGGISPPSKPKAQPVEKPWLKSYPEGVPEKIETPPFRSVRDMIEYPMVEFPDRPAFTNMGTSLTYRDLDRLSLQFACYLQNELGLLKGERVAIMLPNLLQYPVAMCGIFRAGLVAVNVNPLYTARELKHQLADSGARAIVILENFAHTLAEVVTDTRLDKVIVTGVGDCLKFPKGAITNFVLRRIKKQVPAFSLPNTTSFSQFNFTAWPRRNPSSRPMTIRGNPMISSMRIPPRKTSAPRLSRAIKPEMRACFSCVTAAWRQMIWDRALWSFERMAQGLRDLG